MRIILLLLVFLPSVATAQSAVDDDFAIELIQRLQTDPLHDNHQTDIRLIFRWMDESADLMSLINQPILNKINRRKRDYREQMQVLYLAGMVRYLVSHPEEEPPDTTIVNQEGLACMCFGYANLLKKHRIRRDRYFRHLCRNR
jgi:hypothetical protein